MTATDPSPADALGGRLALLATADLDDTQRSTYDALVGLVVPEAEQAGYIARTDDGRFVGPFNALLRVPRIALGMGRWTGEIGAFGLDEQVREAVILTVGAHWRAAFEIYAHVAGARAVGLPEQAIAAIVACEAPSGLSAQATTAQQLTAALLSEHRVADDLYDRAVSAFGEDGVIALLSLIGQYQVISLILVTFQVPAPEGAER